MICLKKVTMILNQTMSEPMKNHKSEHQKVENQFTESIK